MTNECGGHLYGCSYENDDIQECDEAQTLTRMVELAFHTGREYAIDEFITEMKKFYFNVELQSAKDDPCVIDAMIDLAIRTAKQVKERKNDLK